MFGVYLAKWKFEAANPYTDLILTLWIYANMSEIGGVWHNI